MKILKASFILAALPVFVACNQSTQPSGNISNGGTSGGDQQPDDLSTQWETNVLASVGASGLLQANVQSVIDDSTLHLFYYDANTQDSSQYDLKYLSYDLELNQIVNAAETVITIDNSGSLTAAFGESAPQAAYQGGNIRECQGSEQSDAMVSKRIQSWQEETAAIGFVERTAPVLEDGLAGGTMSLAIDDNGNRHLAFQFFYEGCDQNPFAYPDLHYVSLLSGVDYSDPENAPDEEQVDGNVLDTDDNANYNDLLGTGNANVLLLDTNNNPVVVYSAEDPSVTDEKIGLKIANRENGAWSNEWIIDNCTVEGVDAAFDNNGSLGIAVYTTQCEGTEDYDPQLHYVQETNGEWVTQTINMTARAGQYPSIAFDEDNQAMIAFYEIASYQGRELENLKLARFESDAWEIYEVSNLDDVGRYNQLHVLDNGDIALVSFVASENKIVLFRPESS